MVLRDIWLLRTGNKQSIEDLQEELFGPLGPSFILMIIHVISALSILLIKKIIYRKVAQSFYHLEHRSVGEVDWSSFPHMKVLRIGQSPFSSFLKSLAE